MKRIFWFALVAAVLIALAGATVLVELVAASVRRAAQPAPVTA